jgi:hypothetical protein
MTIFKRRVLPYTLETFVYDDDERIYEKTQLRRFIRRHNAPLYDYYAQKFKAQFTKWRWRSQKGKIDALFSPENIAMILEEEKEGEPDEWYEKIVRVGTL